MANFVKPPVQQGIEYNLPINLDLVRTMTKSGGKIRKPYRIGGLVMNTMIYPKLGNQVSHPAINFMMVGDNDKPYYKGGNAMVWYFNTPQLRDKTYEALLGQGSAIKAQIAYEVARAGIERLTKALRESDRRNHGHHSR